MKLFVFLFAGIFMCQVVQAQKHVEGVTIEQGKIALPYVNIGIRHKNIGTVSSADGAFTIDIPQQYANDTLTFSMVGYKELNIRVADIDEAKKEFLLTPADLRLSEFTLAAKRATEKKFGLYKYRPILHFLDASVDQNDIFEIAEVIKLGKTRAKITSVNLHINEPRKDSATFRINFYRYDGHRPAERVIEKSIVQTHAIHEGWLRFDLSQYGVYLKGDIVAGIECLPGTKKKGNKLVYEIKPGGRIKSFVRTNSLGTWQVPPHQYRMYVTALTSEDDHEEEEKEIKPAMRMYSQNVGDSFSIFVRLPKNYERNTSRNYPVIYVLDANLYFSYLSDSLDKQQGDRQPILVGIGYRNFGEMDVLRDRDYTYPADQHHGGGGAKFYDFINKELISVINRQYRTDTANCTLIGHSLGGFFVLYALYREVAGERLLFKHHIAASPSVEYHNEYLRQAFEKIMASQRFANGSILITWGAIEAIEKEAGGTYGEFVGAFITSLSQSNHIHVQTTVFPGAGHMETAIPTLYMGLHKASVIE